MSGSHRVIVSSIDDEEHDRVYRCSGGVTAEEILERWTKDLGLSPDAANLRRPAGAFYRPQEPLFRPGTAEKMAEVIAELCWRLRVALGPEQEQEVTASPGTTPRELLGPLRAAFGLTDTRPMRLANGATTLRPDKGLAAQGVRAGRQNKLRLELGFVGRVTEASNGFLRPFLLFSSEPAARLAEPWLPGECRLGAQGSDGALTPVPLEGDVGAALGRLPDPEDVQVELEVRQGVAVLAACHPRPQVVPTWATAPVNSLLSALEPPPAPLPQPSLVAGALRATSEPVRASEGAVLSAESVPIKLWLKRRCRVLRLPCHSAIVDLRAAATAALDLPPNGALKAAVWVKKGRPVESEEDPRPLAAFCVEHGDSFCADKPSSASKASRQLSVLLANGQKFDFPLAPGEVLRFGDVVSRLAAASGQPRADFRFRVFRCRGCGRGLEVEEEAFQVLPSPCCRQRSLRLAERRLASVGVQSGQADSRRCDRATSPASVQTKNASVDVRPKLVDKNVGGGPKKASKSFATQTKKSAVSKTSIRVESARIPSDPKPHAPKTTPPPQPQQVPLRPPPPPRPPLEPPSFLHEEVAVPKPSHILIQQPAQQPHQPLEQIFPLLSPQQQRAFEMLQRREQEKRQQKAELDQLMALHPGLQGASAQHREALEQQLGQRIETAQLEDGGARGDFLRRLREEEAAVERQQEAARRQREVEGVAAGSQARASAGPEIVRKTREPHGPQFIQKFKQPGEATGRHVPRPEYIPVPRQEEYRPRARQRQPETRQEKRQRRLQELREQFESERQQTGAAGVAEPPGGFHHFAITSLIRGRTDFNCRLRLPAAPRVADVRRELGLEMEVPPSRLRLRRCSVLHGDRRLFRIAKGTSGSRVFGGPDGTSCVVDVPTAMEVRFLDNGNEPFTLVPGEMCMLEVSSQR